MRVLDVAMGGVFALFARFLGGRDRAVCGDGHLRCSENRGRILGLWRVNGGGVVGIGGLDARRIFVVGGLWRILFVVWRILFVVWRILFVVWRILFAVVWLWRILFVVWWCL